MKVKICGIMSVEVARHAVEQGADALGFVFAPSKRQITVHQARDIIKTVPGNIWKVGVFVNETPERIKEIIETVGLSHIQLHGDETPSLYHEIGKPLIKSLSIRVKNDVNRIYSLSSEKSDYILLDSPPGQYEGGSGTSFDWELVAGLDASKSVILAGGLNSDNVKRAIQKVQPFMVDVSSGVETDGKKDLTKISMFIEQAKSARADDDKSHTI